MSQIKQLLLLKKQHVSNRSAAQVLGLNKETVNNYVRKAEADPLGVDGLLALDDPVLEHRLKGGNPAYTDPRFEEFRTLLPYLESEMRRPHVTLRLLWEEYRQSHPKGYGLTQFRFHLKQHVKALRDSRPSTVLKDLYTPGEELFLDFAGDRLSYIDLSTGEVVKVQVFVATLPVTDYSYAVCVPSQCTDDFIQAVINCFHFLGGVPRVLVPDNLKAAVIKADRYQPSVNEVFQDMATHYGCTVCPARVRHPKDKSNVENQVRIIYNRVYAALRNKTFYSLEELNQAVEERMIAHNQKRMQQYPYSRQERFLALEKPVLQPLPPTDYEIRCRTKLRVSENCCVFLGRDKHSYSVPYQHIGKLAQVVYSPTMVSIYVDGQQVAVHARDRKPGGYTMERSHLASHSREFRDRTPQKYVARARTALPELGELVERMFMTSNMAPEMRYRSCDGLLRLQRDTDPDIFLLACRTALNKDRCSYRFVKGLVESGCAGVIPLQEPPSPPSHANLRDRSQFC